MKSLIRAALFSCLVIGAPLTANADPLTYDSLKTLVVGLGYTPKDIGKTTSKMEVLVVTDAFNVPIGVEVTPSGRYVWLTANLGASTIDGDRALQILKRSSDIQPTQFWITSSNTLTIGITINNSEITPTILKFALDKLAADVNKSADLWQAPAPSDG